MTGTECDMAVVRLNVLNDRDARSAYLRGIRLLKHEDTTLTTAQFGIPGPASPVRTYDLFVIWHVLTMNTPVPRGVTRMSATAPTGAPSSCPGTGSYLRGSRCTCNGSLRIPVSACRTGTGHATGRRQPRVAS